MNKYPYISRYEDNAPYIIYNGTLIRCLGHGDRKARHVSANGVKEFFSKNITREYLSNTWGLIESKEHAEFIIELAELHGFVVWDLSQKENPASFKTQGGEIAFFKHVVDDTEGLKQITIPLPPKAESKTPVFHANEIKVTNQFGETIVYGNTSIDGLNEAGHNLVFAAPECKEWPCVGDSVTWGNKVYNGVVKAIDGDLAWIKSTHGSHVTEYVYKLQKPKTPEEALRDDISELICKSNGQWLK